MGPRAAAADPAQHGERVQTRLSTLKDALKLQPGQLDAWNAYEARVAAAAQSRAQMRQSMQDSRGDAQAMADQRVAMMKHNAAAAEEVNTLRKALVATLTPEQKATFEQYAMGQRFAGGPGAAGAQRGHGHGYGPGAGGGRGPGFGRGCIGAA
jgi:Spy/CpxP family protein refolding chaperone